jgi:hypothetical protein
MGNAFLYGNGGNSNFLEDCFAVKAYSSVEDLPEAENENTIAVITDTPIPCYTFTRETPITIGSNLDTVGKVYILVGRYSPAYFDIVNGYNKMRIYPTAVYQCLVGNASDKRVYQKRTAKIYRDGKWIDFEMSIIQNGKQCETVTGGWSSVVEELAGSVSWGEDYLFLGCRDSGGYASVYTNNPIDLKELTAMNIYFSNLSHLDATEDAPGIKIGICSSPYTGTSFDEFDNKMTMCIENRSVIEHGFVTVDLMKRHESGFDGFISLDQSEKYHIQMAVKKSNATIRDIVLFA